MLLYSWNLPSPSLTIRPAPRSKEGNSDGIEFPFRKKDRSWLTASTFSSRDKGWGVNLSTKAAGPAAFVDSPRRNRNIAASTDLLVRLYHPYPLARAREDERVEPPEIKFKPWSIGLSCLPVRRVVSCLVVRAFFEEVSLS